MRSHAKAIAATAAVLLLTFALGAASASADTLPTIATDPASEVGVTTAKLSGSVNPNGTTGDGNTSWRIEYTVEGEEAWNQANSGTIEAPVSEEANAIPVEAVFGFGGELKPGTTYEFRIVAENAAGQAETPTSYPSFTMDEATAPSATVAAASDVEYTTAHFSGTIDPEGGNQNPIGGPLPINWSFQVSTDGGANWADASGGQGEISPAEPEGGGDIPALGNDPITVEADVTGLTHDTSSYEVRLVANYASSTKQAASASESFETAEVTKPSVLLDPVTTFTGDSASFSGEVSPNAPGPAPQDPGFDTTWRFECEPACPSTPDAQTIPGDDADHEVSFDAQGLEPNTDYVVKLIASNVAGEEVATQSFKTVADGPSVAAGTVGSGPGDPTTSARLTAYVDPNNSETTVSFEYDTDPSFGSPETAPSGPGTTVNGNGNEIAYADVTGLEPGTTYHWRAKAQSDGGSDSAAAPKAYPTPALGSGPPERAYELVSNYSRPGGMYAGEISRNGERVLMTSAGGSDQTSFGEVGTVLANRTPSGWKVSAALPPRSTFDSEEGRVVNASPELDRLTLISQRGFGAAVAGEPASMMTYVPATGEVTPGAFLPEGPAGDMASNVASDDQRHVVAMVGKELLDLTSPNPQNIGLMPDGLPAACGGVYFFAINGSALYSSHWISTDGSRVFFYARGHDCEAANLYMREGGEEGETTLIDGPPLSGPNLGGYFVQATADGAEVFFTTATQLDPDDANSSGDLYRHTVGVGNECLTCVVPEAELPSDLAYPMTLVAESGERAYFTSVKALAPGASFSPSAPNLYSWRADDPDTIAFVAPGNQMTTAGSYQNALTTPDGRALIFVSNRSELNDLTGRPNGGLVQRYRYDERTGSLNCVSCPADGAEISAGWSPTSDTTGMYQIGRKSTLTRDGSSYFFSAGSNALVPEDVNGSSDIYEWRDGRVALVTDGRSGVGPGLHNVTPDGRNVLFSQGVQLTPDAPDANAQTYVARVEGGFPNVPPPAPCAGDLCRSGSSAPPAEPAPTTPSFQGPGNRKPPCANGKVKKRGVCVSKKARKTQKKQSKNRGKDKNRANADRGGSK